jgi:hypothetical protein
MWKKWIRLYFLFNTVFVWSTSFLQLHTFSVPWFYVHFKWSLQKCKTQVTVYIFWGMWAEWTKAICSIVNDYSKLQMVMGQCEWHHWSTLTWMQQNKYVTTSCNSMINLNASIRSTDPFIDFPSLSDTHISIQIILPSIQFCLVHSPWHRGNKWQPIGHICTG